ncbi:polymer-forming cytoskeletal protein [Acidovorax sp. SUPP1855]|uniref:bactofilin family protein n=1 Tax=Acidovorax sp. SUPP1855 TaxID=431774 RepID=UPI0023DE2D19|nr:polymer-forming cytoskeletal protein [Acidovorax sp. SUPP1855]GKS87631.1 polymer-forming cytoskeletal protein [Acidovorax sp. SUPP1855]
MPEYHPMLLAFATACAALFLLPFVPAIREWRRPTDSAALLVPPDHAADIDHFARRLRADAQARLGQGESTGYESFDLISPNAAPAAWASARARLLACGDVTTPAAILAFQPVFVDGSMHVGAGSAFSSLYATRDLELGDGSKIADWAHADGELRLGPGSTALRRVSAGAAVKLAAPCWFERLHAPVVRLGGPGTGQPSTAPPTPTPPAPQTASYATLAHAIQRTPQLYMVRGDCTLAEHSIYRGSLVVTGFLTISPFTTVIGDIKARGGITLGEGAVVHGAITCEQSAYLLPGALALGPVVCEGDVMLGARTVVGLPDALTTVSGRCIVAEEGAVVHGTLWAHEIGMVKQA